MTIAGCWQVLHENLQFSILSFQIILLIFKPFVSVFLPEITSCPRAFWHTKSLIGHFSVLNALDPNRHKTRTTTPNIVTSCLEEGWIECVFYSQSCCCFYSVLRKLPHPVFSQTWFCLWKLSKHQNTGTRKTVIRLDGNIIQSDMASYLHKLWNKYAKWILMLW